MRKGVRWLSIQRGRPNPVPPPVVAAAQMLRHSGGSGTTPVEPILRLAEALAAWPAPTPGLPSRASASSTAKNPAQSAPGVSTIQYFNLISRSLERSHLKTDFSGSQLQTLFRAAAQHAALPLATQLYVQLQRHARVSSADRWHNGVAFYRVLRATGHAREADAQVAALVRDLPGEATSAALAGLVAVAAATPDATPAEVGRAVVAIVKASGGVRPNGPPQSLLAESLGVLAPLGEAAPLDDLTEYMLHENPHFEAGEDLLVMLLDAFLQIKTPAALPAVIPKATIHGVSGIAADEHRSAEGRIEGGVSATGSSPAAGRVLHHLLARGPTSIDVLELLLRAIVHLEESPSAGRAAFTRLQARSQTAWAKETWDVVAQWTLYSEPDMRRTLDLVDAETAEWNTAALASGHGAIDDAKTIDDATATPDTLNSPDMPDVTTLRILIGTACRARRSEADVQRILAHFGGAGIFADASVHAVLLRRALQAGDAERARQLFVASNVDWSADGGVHSPVLDELLIALAVTPAVAKQTVVDTYERVRLFARLGYAAQVAMLRLLLEEDVTPAGLFLIEQFGETPALAFETHREMFDLFFYRILAATDGEEALRLFGVLNCTVTLPYEAYYPLLLKLSRLGRPDATHALFRQLRQRAKNGTRPPGEEIYVMLFHEYATNRYEEGVHELAIYFRMDLNNEMSVSVLNRMLAAFAALGENHKLSYVWSELLALPPGSLGPNEESMATMLRWFGREGMLDAVDDVWATTMSRFGIKPTPNLLSEYVVANCYNGHYTRALELVKHAPEYGVDTTPELLRDLYNWTLLPARKEQVREFALERFPQEWAKIEDSGELRDVLLPAADGWDESETARRTQAISELEKVLAVTK